MLNKLVSADFVPEVRKGFYGDFVLLKKGTVSVSDARYETVGGPPNLFLRYFPHLRRSLHRRPKLGLEKKMKLATRMKNVHGLLHKVPKKSAGTNDTRVVVMRKFEQPHPSDIIWLKKCYCCAPCRTQHPPAPKFF